MKKLQLVIECLITIGFIIASLYFYGFNIMWLTIISVFTLLLILSHEDIKTKHISSHIILQFGVIGIIMLPINANITATSTLLWTVIIGVGFLLLHKITRGALGLGDVETISLIILYLGVEYGLLVILLGIVLSGLVGLFLIAINKANRKTEIPFIPFLFLGFVITTLLFSVS